VPKSPFFLNKKQIMKTFLEEIIAKEIDASVARFKEALREADNAEEHVDAIRLLELKIGMIRFKHQD
jgi:hypothetical protein